QGRWSATGTDATASRSGSSRPSARFQPTKTRVCTSALRHPMLLPSMHFTRRHCAQAGITTVRPACARFMDLTTMPPSSSIQTDTASRRTTVQPKSEVSLGRLQMFAIRKADGNDEDIVLGLWKQLIDYHRSIEAFRPERWDLPPEEVIRPILTAAWENP